MKIARNTATKPLGMAQAAGAEDSDFESKSIVVAAAAQNTRRSAVYVNMEFCGTDRRGHVEDKSLSISRRTKMNTKHTVLLAALIALLVTPLGATSQSASERTALTVVIDASWSCDHSMADLRALARQVISALEPGDYCEIISAHAWNPRLRRAQTIKTNGAKEIEAVAELLDSITCGFLSDARVSKAVEMAFTRLENVRAQSTYDRGAVIVFSDGKLADRDAKALLTLLQDPGRCTWPLYMTGSGSTNRRLLVAANNDVLSFALTKEANPALWLEGLNAVIRPQMVADTASQPTHISGEQEAADTNEHAFTWEYPFTGTADESQDDSMADVVTDEQASVPVALSEKTPPAEPNNISPTHQWSLGRLARWLWWLLLLSIVGVAVGVAAGLLRSRAKARKWVSGISARLKDTRKKDPGVLVARFNGRSHTLGRADRLGAVHIGSGPENTVRIADKSITARHAKIFRRRGDLLLKNLSRAPFSVNGTPLKGGRQQRLTLPSTLELSETVKLNLALSQPKAASKDERRSNQHESRTD